MLAETVRYLAGARRSDHPQVSFAAVGPRAAGDRRRAPLDDGAGRAVAARRGLPAGRAGAAAGLRARHEHVAAPGRVRGSRIRRGTTRLVGAGGRTAPPQWVTWADVDEDESDFEQIGADFEATGAATVGPVGRATARLMRQRAVVDFATTWIGVNRVTPPSV